MPTFTGKSFSTFYKNILGINQSSNTGIDATGRKIQDGAGNNTAISLSDDDLSVKPVNDDTTRTFRVQKQNNDTVFAIDTTNSKVFAGSTQTVVNTFYQPFSCHLLTPVAGEHMPLLAVPAGYYATALAEQSLGDGADPATTYDMSTGNLAANWVACLFPTRTNMTVDSCDVYFTSNGGAESTLTFHLMSYAIDGDNGGTSGDLSDGVVVADSGTQAVDRTSIDFLSLSIRNADVDISRILIATVESTATNSVTVNMNLKYHIR